MGVRSIETVMFNPASFMVLMILSYWVVPLYNQYIRCYDKENVNLIEAYIELQRIKQQRKNDVNSGRTL